MINQKKMRDFLRKTENKFISEKVAAQILKVDKKAALEILIQLKKLGFIGETGIDGLWQHSIRGKLLTHKRVSKEFRVDTLKRQLNNLIKRVEIVNSSSKYPDRVSYAIVTSEYPIEHISRGVDIAYSLSSKGFSQEEYDVAADELRKEYHGNFNNIVEHIFYPHTAIRIFLKSRSPVLKLQNYSEEEIKNITGHKIIG